MSDTENCVYQKEHGLTCHDLFDCCDCGGNDCGCAYCFSCNACECCIEN